MSPRPRTGRDRVRESATRASAAATPLPPVSSAHPAMLLVLALLAASALLGATFQMMDTDVWQHLAVGRVIWTEHRIPATNEWTWPTYGAPNVLPSWGFRALLWPFWALGGIPGLSLWRWLTTLATFALLWRVARRLGARGFAALAMLGWCLLVFRHRIYVRPETLNAL